MAKKGLLTRIGEKLTKYGGYPTAEDLLKRFQPPPGLAHSVGPAGMNQVEPPYARRFSPMWIYRIRRNSSLINNAMRQKIWQTFRGGFTEWEKAYDAKCPRCQEEFQGFDAFREQMDDDEPDDGPPEPPGGAMGGMMADGGMPGMMPEMEGEMPGMMPGMDDGDVDPQEFDEDDIDLDSERTCPECEEVVQMLTPDPEVKHHADSYFDRANCRSEKSPVHLEPQAESSISQSFMEVMEEIAWDIQSFDDGWLLFERSYRMDENGVIVGYELENVYRGPPELMRWSVDPEQNQPGGEFWACVRCRNAAEPGEYEPEREEQNCSICGNVTYPVYAVGMQTPSGNASTGGQPLEFFIRGEFYHDSEYERKRWYGFPPVMTLWEEARTLEQMDKWYNDAYEERRAPRGALLVNAAHDADLRAMNRQQMEQMREDPNYIPLFMNDSEEEGDPIKFVELLSEPAEMQHMEMREWFVDRIGAHFGVTAILMESSPGDSGLSQSMEVEVSEKQAEHFRDVLNNFVDAFLAQIGTEGWTRQISDVNEENPMEEAQLVGQHLNNAQKALQVGAEVEWTPDNRAEIKEGELEMEGEMDMMGMEGGIQGPRGPEPHSLEPGQDPMGPQPEGERAREGPADSPAGPDDLDRPAATPLKSVLTDEYGDDRLEKIAAKAFNTPQEGADVQVTAD